MNKWPGPRPIEEAPKDRRILGWEPFLSQGGWWIIAEWDEPEEQWVDHDGEICELTHFLPLPPKLEVASITRREEWVAESMRKIWDVKPKTEEDNQ